MGWLLTFTGKRFDPLAPRSDDVDLVDIAHALSLTCRFCGHCRTFYSVAEHSVRASQLVAMPHARWALLHDAAEAYVTDLPRPLKGQLPQFAQLEDRVLRAIAVRFDLGWPMPDEVRVADDAMLATELRDLMAPLPEPAELRASPLPQRLVPWSARRAEQRFLRRCRELGL
jgi:hypothetical protein